MALRMIHILAYHCEDGLILTVHDSHIDRDRDWEAAQEEWRAIDGKGKAPCAKMDTFVPMEATMHDVNKMIRSFARRFALMNVIKDMLGL